MGEKVKRSLQRKSIPELFGVALGPPPLRGPRESLSTRDGSPFKRLSWVDVDASGTNQCLHGYAYDSHWTEGRGRRLIAAIVFLLRPKSNDGAGPPSELQSQ